MVDWLIEVFQGVVHFYSKGSFNFLSTHFQMMGALCKIQLLNEWIIVAESIYVISRRYSHAGREGTLGSLLH